MFQNSNNNSFLAGLIFGFDVGTASIGYAVRHGTKFLDVGVLICPEDTSDLSGRRGLRRQRRTLRSRKYRHRWFAKELEKLGLAPSKDILDDPISLRVNAINGEKLKPEELHVALTHLFKRRGYTEVPWANREATDNDKEEGVIKESVKELRGTLDGQLPCQYLALEREKAGKSPTRNWARKIYWPRESLHAEFVAILKAQEKHFPNLAKKAEWLLYGDTQEVKGHRVFFNAAGAYNPGVLGQRWPRFDNRGPALDSLQPVDELGRSQHVVRKSKKAFIKAQWELAVMNFRVIDRVTGKLTAPDNKSLLRLREIWESSKHKKKTASVKPLDERETVKISEAVLERWEKDFSHQYKLVEGQPPLTPQTGAGRARYSSLTLDRISAGERFAPPQPILQRKGESAEQALNRYLSDIKHPLVRHRLTLFKRLLHELIHGTRHKKGFGEPDLIVLEAVRSLALGKKAKNELNRKNERFRKDREIARDQLSSINESVSRKAIQRYRLWKEAHARCPFCLQTIERTDLGHGADIEHLVPRSSVDCNEFYNLTVAHLKCNRELKGNRTPFAAFNGLSYWSDIKDNAEKTFSGRKLEIFLSPNAEELIEQKADLQHTAYLARVIRHVSLIQLGWLGEEGRDPTPEKQNSALRFQVTNGQLTSRLRKGWGLNQILHPLPPGKRWDELTSDEQNQFTEKNRGDHRHHALDAMVIACTLPWLAHRTHGAKDQFGRHGWWTQDEKHRSKVSNPIFPNEGQIYEVVSREIDKVAVKHHVSRSNHKRVYDTTIYGKKADDVYVARDKLSDLKEKDFSNVYPESLGSYLMAAWEAFQNETPSLIALLKTTKGKLPAEFIDRLCFAHFQRWREAQAPFFQWPQKVKIPIRSVKYIGVHDDKVVAPASPGTKGFIARRRYKEVRIHLSIDGRYWVPVFVPYWKRDRLIHDQQYQPRAPIQIIQIGDLIDLKNGYGPNNPSGVYRVTSTMQKQIQLLPINIADTKEALKASGFLENGINLRWPAFFKAVGYELPHPASPQPQSPSPAEA